MTRRCAFLTMDDTAGWSIDADLAIEPLQRLGWAIETVPWRQKDRVWSRFDAVYIGTPWDYPDDAAGFVEVLESIERAGPVLVNPLSLVLWNLSKTYLRDLEARGVAIVPSHWHDALTADMIDSFFDAWRSACIIVKPVVSTNANDTFLLTRDLDGDTRQALLRTFRARGFMVQPFIGGIQAEGEFSLFYIGGAFSHAIRKTPKAADFRVQEEHGARIVAVDPEQRLIDCADSVLARVDPAPVYARCDFVRDDDGAFLLMELELIEPSLYLRMDDAAPARFAAAFDRYVRRVACSRAASGAASGIPR